ncbi:MAG: transcription antitermination factor NusB [Phycisphaerales bacterium]
MPTPRDIRRLALLALYQLDAGSDSAGVRASLDDLESLREEGLVFVDREADFEPADRDRACAIAEGAWEHRAEADAELRELAPEWPPSRQAAVDRAILRLAHHEIVRGESPPKAVVNEAVELAKAFSTEKSPAFVNGLLGKVLKRVLLDASSPVANGGGAERSEAEGV